MLHDFAGGHIPAWHSHLVAANRDDRCLENNLGINNVKLVRHEIHSNR